MKFRPVYPVAIFGVVAIFVGVSLLYWGLGQPLSDHGAIQYGDRGEDLARFLAGLTSAERTRIAAKAPKAYTNPDEAQQYFLAQRTGGAPLDYSLIVAGKATVAKMPRVWIGGDGFEMNGALLAPGEKATVGDLIAWTELGPGNIGGRTRSI